MKNIKLLLQTLIKFFLGVIILSVLIFLPAGTINYYNGWLLMGTLFIPMFVLGIVLYMKDKELLKKRLNSREKEKQQKRIIIISLNIFLFGFILAGIDFRYGWSNMPLWLNVLGCVVLLISYIIYIEVMRENMYLSRTVEIQENQKVISNGLYGIVRHPMYFATIFIFLSFAIILGSWISFAIFCMFPFVLASRIKNEEAVLKKGLDGYEEYMKKVKYRIIPFIW